MKNLKEKKYRILSQVSKFSFVFIIVFSLMVPLMFVGAINGTGKIKGTGSAEGIGGVNINTNIKNPLTGGINTIPDFINAVINIVLIVGIPILVLAIIYAGFLFVKAQGNSGELEVAKRTLLYTIIGGALLLGAFVIANAIGSTVAELGK